MGRVRIRASCAPRPRGRGVTSNARLAPLICRGRVRPRVRNLGLDRALNPLGQSTAPSTSSMPKLYKREFANARLSGLAGAATSGPPAG
eukprot:3662845-Alexandrium_andersonii.AAC.1